MKKKARRTLYVATLIIAVIFSLYYIKKPLSVELYEVKKNNAVLYFIEQGHVNSNEKIEVHSIIQGEVVSINVKEHQYVNKGDIICVIDSSELKSKKELFINEISGYKGQIENLKLTEKQERDNQRLNLEVLENEYESLTAKEKDINLSKEEQLRLQNILIEQNQKEYDFALRELENARILYESGVMSRDDYSVYDKDVHSAKTILETSIKQLDIINAGLGELGDDYIQSLKEALKSQIDSLNNHLNKSYISGMNQYYNSLIESINSQIEFLDKQIADCIVKAPAEGEIISLGVKNSNIVSQPVAVISSERAKEIEVYVSTKDIADINVEDKVEITFKKQSDDINFGGEVKLIDNEAQLKVSSLGIEERRVRVLIEPYETEEIVLKNGYDVDVKFILYEEQDVLTIPKTAFYKWDNKNYVFIADSGKLEEKEIELGTELRTEYVVKSGIEEGNILIKDIDNEKLREGVSIKIE